MKRATVTIVSKPGVPMLQNRYNGEEPTKAKPRKKTEAYLDEQRKEKWMKAAHFQDGMFCVPPEVIEGALYSAAAAMRKKNDFKMAVAVEDVFIPLLVNRGTGYKSLEGNLEDFYIPEFIYVRGVPTKPGGTGPMAEQCRPIFKDWSIQFSIQFDDSIVDEKDVRAACENMMIGSFRPRFGRSLLQAFEIQSSKARTKTVAG